MVTDKLKIKDLVLLVGSVILAFVFAEIGLRLVGIAYPYFQRPDPVKGWALRPDVSGFSFGEVDNYTTINSQGLRDLEHTISKPADTLRIAILGDSYAEALQVTTEHAFWTVVKKSIEERKCATRFKAIETINFGVSAYGTAQELLVLRQDVWQYAPDIVLLALFTHNDFVDNTSALNPTRQNSRPFFRIVNGELSYDGSFFKSQSHQNWIRRYDGIYYWLHEKSRIVQTLRRATRAWRGSGLKTTGGTSEEQETNRPALYKDPTDDNWKEAWNVTERLILTMAREVEARGSRFVLVTLTNPIQMHLDAELINGWMKKHGIVDLFYPDKRLQRFAHKHGLLMLALAPRMRRYAEMEKIYLHGFKQNLGKGHWNKHGHQIAGDLIADYICENAHIIHPR